MMNNVQSGNSSNVEWNPHQNPQKSINNENVVSQVVKNEAAKKMAPLPEKLLHDSEIVQEADPPQIEKHRLSSPAPLPHIKEIEQIANKKILSDDPLNHDPNVHEEPQLDNMDQLNIDESVADEDQLNENVDHENDKANLSENDFPNDYDDLESALLEEEELGMNLARESEQKEAESIQEEMKGKEKIKEAQEKAQQSLAKEEESIQKSIQSEEEAAQSVQKAIQSKEEATQSEEEAAQSAQKEIQSAKKHVQSVATQEVSEVQRTEYEQEVPEAINKLKELAQNFGVGFYQSPKLSHEREEELRTTRDPNRVGELAEVIFKEEVERGNTYELDANGNKVPISAEKYALVLEKFKEALIAHYQIYGQLPKTQTQTKEKTDAPKGEHVPHTHVHSSVKSHPLKSKVKKEANVPQSLMSETVSARITETARKNERDRKEKVNEKLAEEQVIHYWTIQDGIKRYEQKHTDEKIAVTHTTVMNDSITKNMLRQRRVR